MCSALEETDTNFFFSLSQDAHLQSWYILEMLPHATWRKFKSSRWEFLNYCTKLTNYNPVKAEFMAELLYWIASHCTSVPNKVVLCHIFVFPSSGFSMDCCWWAGGPHAGASTHPTEDYDIRHSKSEQKHLSH